MSIFKTIGNKLKRVISLKNVMSAATGNFTAVLADAKRVATTPDKKNKSISSQVTYEVPQLAPDVQQFIDSAVTTQENTYQNFAARKIGASKFAQNNVDSASNLMSKVWFQALWQKHKHLIIIIGVTLLGLISWLLFFRKKQSTSKGRVRR